METLTSKMTKGQKKGMKNALFAAVVLFSVKALAGEANVQYAQATDLASAYAYPVPYKPSLGQNSITFINLSSEATIRVYSLDGVLVKTLLETDSDGLLRWDGKNEEGSPLSSDVYVYVIENREQTKIGKLLVIR